ncbi:MAG: hypothetical protein U0172_12715 [Nitrospiraceae bacterium]
MQRLSAAQIWGMPVVLGVSTAVGLASALVGDGPSDVLSWFGLGMPLVVLWGYLARGASNSCDRTPHGGRPPTV